MSSNQTTFIWDTPVHINAKEFRARLAKSAGDNNIALDPKIFWHDESGNSITPKRLEKNKDKEKQEGNRKTPVTEADKALGYKRTGPKNESELDNMDRVKDSSMPMVRFFHINRGVGINFIGIDAMELAAKQAMNLVQAANAAIGYCPLKVQEATVDIKKLSYAKNYVLPLMALKAPNFDFLSPEEFAERIIRQDTMRQAKILGIEVPEGVFIKVMEIAEKEYGYTNESHRGPRTPGAKLLHGVCFVSNIDFKGSWSFGSMLSKGFGAVRPLNHSFKRRDSESAMAEGA